MGYELFCNKKGALGEHTLMIARLFLLTFVTFILLGISAMVYSYDINVRDVEARIMARALVNCFIEKGVFEGDGTDLEGEEIKYNVLDYCGITGDLDRYYVKITIFDNMLKNKVFQQGDGGAEWVRNIKGKYAGADEYLPGYFGWRDGVRLKDDDGISCFDGEIQVEVLVNADI